MMNPQRFSSSNSSHSRKDPLHVSIDSLPSLTPPPRTLTTAENVKLDNMTENSNDEVDVLPSLKRSFDQFTPISHSIGDSFTKKVKSSNILRYSDATNCYKNRMRTPGDSSFSENEHYFVARFAEAAMCFENQTPNSNQNSIRTNDPFANTSQNFCQTISPFHSLSSIGSNIGESLLAESVDREERLSPCPHSFEKVVAMQDGASSILNSYHNTPTPNPALNGNSDKKIELGVDRDIRKARKFASDHKYVFGGPTAEKPDKMFSEFCDAKDKDSCKKWIRWSEEEDQILRDAVEAEGVQDWKTISRQYFGGTRSQVQCKNRWRKALQPGLVKGRWTTEEDDTIRDCVMKGMQRWSDVAKHVPGRIGEQCKERWHNAVDPNIKRGAWSVAETITLKEAQEKLGNRWSQIAKMLPGRSENAVKNRWYNRKTSERRLSKGQNETRNDEDEVDGRGSYDGTRDDTQEFFD